MNICKVCGAYTDPYEWPESELCNYRANLCYKCYLEQQQEEEDEAEEAEPSDDPEEEQEFIVNEDQEQQEDTSEEQVNATPSPGQQVISEDEQNIRAIREMLFG